MKIKTITAQTSIEFDEAVNAALAEGWTLKRRDIQPPAALGPGDILGVFYAELELEEERSCRTCRHIRNCKLCDGQSRWEAAER